MPDIWEELRTDRESGARRLVAEYGNRLYAAALFLCKNAADAEELVFRTLEQAARHIAQYEPKGEFFSWLYVIMRNFRLMDLRKNEPEILPVGAPQDLPEVPDAKLAEALSSVDAGTVRAAVRNLPDFQSEVLVLRFLEGRSMEEISAMIGIPVGTVKSRLHNAKAALRDALAELRNGGVR